MGNVMGIEGLYRAIDAANNEKNRLAERAARVDEDIARLNARIEKIFGTLDDVDAAAVLKRHPNVPGRSKRVKAPEPEPEPEPEPVDIQEAKKTKKKKDEPALEAFPEHDA